MNISVDLGQLEPLVRFKLPYFHPHIHERLTEKLSLIFHWIPEYKPLVFACVGTDRSTGDALGPLVGSRLSRLSLPGIHLYGTLEKPVHALNLEETLKEIQSTFHDPFIVAVDASLGRLESVGSIQVGLGPVYPGAGVKKELPPIGDLHITGVVNISGFMEYYVLQNTRLSIVMKMAEIIADAIHAALLSVKREPSIPFSVNAE